MAGNLQIVFSYVPDGVTDEEFGEWYDAHLPEILSIPGFVSAQRYRLEPVVSDATEPVSYRYLALYEVDADPETLLAEMAKLRLGNIDSYAERKAIDSSGPPLPEWWDRVRFASWNCIALGERVSANAVAG
ncbi:MAG TPA: hypothetical protein VFC22_07285 [Solirubrobacteraceae bacterium]|nr:hypothetical protein [Solirubrobacteraceae bacterium]